MYLGVPSKNWGGGGTVGVGMRQKKSWWLVSVSGVNVDKTKFGEPSLPRHRLAYRICLHVVYMSGKSAASFNADLC